MNRKVPYCTILILLIFGITLGTMHSLWNMRNDITFELETKTGDVSILEPIQVEATILQDNSSCDWMEVILQGGSNEVGSKKYRDGTFKKQTIDSKPDLWLETDVLSNLPMSESYQEGTYYLKDYYATYPLSVSGRTLVGTNQPYILDDSMSKFNYLFIKPNVEDKVEIKREDGSMTIFCEDGSFQRISLPIRTIGERIFTTIPTISRIDQTYDYYNYETPLSNHSYTGTSGIFELKSSEVEATFSKAKEFVISNVYPYSIGSDLEAEVIDLVTCEEKQMVGLITLEDGKKLMLYQYSLLTEEWIGTRELCNFGETVDIHNANLYSNSSDFQVLLKYSKQGNSKDMEYQWLSFIVGESGQLSQTVTIHRSYPREEVEQVAVADNSEEYILSNQDVKSTIYIDGVLYVLSEQLVTTPYYSIYKPSVVALRGEEILYYGVINSSFYEDYRDEMISYGIGRAWDSDKFKIEKSEK